MRFIFFILMLLATVNLLIILLSGLTGVNIYKKHGPQIIKVLFEFLLFVVATFVSLALAGLVL